jgi:dienelactone hydrolase
MVSCCPEGSHGLPASAYIDGKGKLETWTLDSKSIETYVIGPEDAKMNVVFVQDIFSMHATRVKGLADFLADKGYRVVLPDWHKGDSMVETPDFREKFPAWKTAHPHEEVVRMAEDCFKKIRVDGKKMVTIGFCWGSWILYHC